MVSLLLLLLRFLTAGDVHQPCQRESSIWQMLLPAQVHILLPVAHCAVLCCLPSQPSIVTAKLRPINPPPLSPGPPDVSALLLLLLLGCPRFWLLCCAAGRHPLSNQPLVMLASTYP
jgi:hypothetical protein